jgi:hypothetical protein
MATLDRRPLNARGFVDSFLIAALIVVGPTTFAERQAYVEGLASYSNLRRFTVTAREDLK